MRAAFLSLVLLVPLLAPPSVLADEISDAKKEFKQLGRSESWKDRAAAYDSLAMIDSALAVDEALKALVKEKNIGVVVAGIRMLSGLVSEDAIAALRETAAKPKGNRGFYAIVALADMRGTAGQEELLALLEGTKDLPMAAQAAVALGKKQIHAAVPQLVRLLGHKAWQMRTAAARGLLLMAGPIPDRTKPEEKGKPWVPASLDVDALVGPLVTALAAAQGSERRPMIHALERLTQQDFGYDPAAWRAFAAGAKPDQIRRKPKKVPYIAGLPVYGKRVIFLIDNVTRTDDAVPFDNKERLKELCEVPDARRVPWFNIKTIRDFMHAHLLRAVMDLPKRGVKFEVVIIGNKGHLTFGKLQGASPGSKKKIATMLEKLKVESGNDTYAAMRDALDISGKKDSAAWSKGPDELIYLNCTVPWLASEVEDEDVVGAAMGLKARRRMVPIHTIGVGPHARGLSGALTGLSGGVYLPLEK